MAQSISGARQFLLHNFPAVTADEKEAHAKVVRGVRGATSIESNEPAQILEKTRELVREVMQSNAIMPDDIALLQFILTHDIDAVFPARAARELGLNTVPLIDTLSPDVQNAEPGIIRLVLLWNTNKRQREISHVYLGRAGRLRPDLVAGRDTGRSSL
jgi:monofunctional chorismate mutase